MYVILIGEINIMTYLTKVTRIDIPRGHRILEI